MNIRAAKARLRVQEIPSFERPRVHGESNLHVFYDGWRILTAIAAEAIGPRRQAGRRRACQRQGAPAPTAGREAASTAPPESTCTW
jgi:hypothetical protein